MKKFASLLMTVVLLAAMLTVFAVPAFAETEPTPVEPRTIVILPDYGLINELFIDDPGDYIIKHDVDVFALSIVGAENAVLTIPEGVTVVVRNAIDVNGTVELLGTLDVSQCNTIYNDCLDHINVGATGNLIKREGQFLQQGTDPGKIITKEPDFGEIHLGSALSGGSLTIIVGISCLAVGLVGGLLLGRKKKKPATAGGESKDEE